MNAETQNLPTETIQKLAEAERLRFARELRDSLRSIDDLQVLRNTVCRTMAQRADTQRACFVTIDQEHAQIIVAGEHRPEDAPPFTGTHPIRHLSFLFRALHEDQPFVCENTVVSPALDETDKAFYDTFGIHSLLVAPLVAGSRLIGCILLADGHPHAWDTKTVGMAREAARVVEDGLHRLDLVSAEQHTRELLQLRDEFIGNATHELRTPLTSIHAYGQLLETEFKERGDEASSRLMRRLNTQIDRLYRLVSDLVDTTRIAAGQLLLQRSTFDMNRLIREQAEDLQLITDKHSLVLQLGPLPAVTADRERIGQVITNLVSNAIKYSPDRGDIIISSEQLPQGVRVAVKDHGMGIPPEAVNKIFERFFRVNDAVVRTSSGMGIGLYICAAIIHAHCGTIDVQSTPGNGSAFSFILPSS